MSLKKETRIYKTFLISTCLATALCMSGIFLGMSIRTNRLIYEGLLSRARSQFEGISLTREWSAHYGGVYVEKKEGVASNPFLKDPDIAATDKRVYTLKNPALITREISELSQKKGNFTFRITSLKPLNPDNVPDEFEQKALKSFESGAPELYGMEDRGGKTYFRYMAPLQVNQECLRCHGQQGYKPGDVRGGISVFFEVEELQRKLRLNTTLIAFLGTVTTVLLLSLLWFFTERLTRKVAEAREEIEKMAKTDGLTGLYNRRHAIERFEEEFERVRRQTSAALGCIMLDIDHFKRINDEYGHQTGDEVLKRFGALLKESVRTYDIAGRFGGEELIIVLPETGYADCRSFAERLRYRIKGETFPAAGAPETLQVTASFGVAVTCDGDHSVDDIIRRADEALYQAKRGGRDRVGPLEG